MDDDKLTVMLSPREMLYLYASQGLPLQSMIGNPYKDYKVENLKDEIASGHESLATRNLIEQVTLHKWRLDSALETLMNTMTSPDHTLLVNHILKDEGASIIFFYFKEGAGISLQFKNSRYIASTYPDEKSLLKYLLPALGVGKQPAPEIPPFSIPTDNLMETLNKCWESRSAVVEEFKKRGMEQKEAMRLVGALAQVNAISSLTLLVREGKTIAKKRQALFLTSTSSIWLYEGMEEVNPHTIFTPIPTGMAYFKAQQFARGYEVDIKLQETVDWENQVIS